jgi:hypothetical protein
MVEKNQKHQQGLLKRAVTYRKDPDYGSQHTIKGAFLF